MKRTNAVLTMILLVPAAQAGDPSRLSAASQLSGAGAARIVEGSLVGVAGSAQFTVTAAEAVGEGMRVALEGSARAGKLVLTLPIAVAGGASVAVGETVTLVATGAGWLLTRAGEMIGFIPNEAGKALLHSEPVQAVVR